LLVTIKPHSAFKQFFSEKQYVADLKTYADVLYYLNGMHKGFIHYLRKQKERNIDESFVFLDKNLRVINTDELHIKHAREGDVIHIVPAVVGGGGKRGGLLAILAIAAFIFLPMLAPALGGLGGGTGIVAGSTAGTAMSATGVVTSGGLSGMLQNLVVNIGLALLSSLFATKPKEEETRQNDMFGSLTNSTNSGTPVALNYGMMRVAGQMINGYVLSMGHAKTQYMNIYGEVIANETSSSVEQDEKRSSFLSGFNSFT
jgi:predicted phage tail protein